MAINKKQRQQISVVIVVAVVLILLLLAGILLFPTTTKKLPAGNSDISSTVSNNNSSDSGSDSNSNTNLNNDEKDSPKIDPDTMIENNQKVSYTVTVKVIDENYSPITNTKFVISLKDTVLNTDANGYIVLKNLPQGLYKIFATDEKGAKNENIYCDFQLSSDGGVSVGYVFFKKDQIVYIMFDGKTLKGIEEKDLPKSDNESEEELIIEEEDDTYTNFSWMKNVEKEYGAYGISLYKDPELFYEVLNNPEYSYFNTFLLPGNNLDLTLETARELVEKDKKMWLEVNELIAFKSFGGAPVPSGNLMADWQKVLTEWATEIKAIAGDNFQGFYFDEPSYYYNSRDFTRITKYMRETFKLRTFACHCSVAYMTPYNRGRDIIGYTPAPNDPMVISPQNHKYVTDVAWWRYGSVRDYGDIDLSFGEWSKAMSQLDENTRKWYVPAIGAYYWDTLETDTLDIQYTMFKNNAALDGFGGIMHYTMSWSSLSGRPTPVDINDKRLTEKDFYYDAEGNKHISLDHNYSSVDLRDAYMEGNGAYFVMEKQEDGTYRWPKVRQYMEILGKGIMNNESYDNILAKLEAVYKPDFSKYKK